MKMNTSKITILCKLALAASMLLGAAQWANAADKTPAADDKPGVAKGIKDQGVKGVKCSKRVNGECVAYEE
jgi:homospermidine synthase